MPRGEAVLERQVIHAGKTFIRAGEEHARAYVVQNGLIRSYVMEGDQRIDVCEYEPGRIIGETCLMVDEPMNMTYEAVVDTTVITITRQDFQKKIARIDQDIATILDHVMNKLNYHDLNSIEKAKKRAEIDGDAFAMVDALTAGLEQEKKHLYENAILPHVNALIKAIKEIKASTRGETNDDTPAEAVNEDSDD